MRRPASRSAVGYGDLLFALADTQHDPLRRARWVQGLGFERGPDDLLRELPEGERLSAEQPATASAVLPAARPPLQATLYAVTQCEVLNATPRTAPIAADERATLQPPDAEDCRPLKVGVPPYTPLSSAARTWPVLRGALGHWQRGVVDIDAAVAAVARARPLSRLPLKRRLNWSGDLWIVWDRSIRLIPYARDFAGLVHEVHKRHGDVGLQLWCINGEPDGIATGFCFPRGKPQFARRIPDPPAGARVLILSDLGALALDEDAAERWQQFLSRLVRCGARPNVWVPLSARLAPPQGSAATRLYSLAPGARARPIVPASGHDQWQANREAVSRLMERLLERMAWAIKVEPGLLRALRLLTPDTAAEPGLEALIWEHCGGYSVCCLPPELVAHYRTQASQRERDGALRTILDFHAYRGRAVGYEELLAYAAHTDAENISVELRGAIAEAERWFQRVACSPAGADAETAAFSQAVLAYNQDARWRDRYQDIVAGLSSKAGMPMPRGAAHAIRNAQLAQHAEQLRFEPEAPKLHWSAFRASGETQWLPERGASRWLNGVELPSALISLDPLRRVHGRLVTADLRYTIAALERPAWATQWGRDRYGVFAEFELRGTTQRLRYIEPGEFDMGSPEHEAGRDGEEGPRHRVRLTRGFWLADTACTQALWQAVMGNNPSEFKDDVENPVERVSWDDVQQFLKKLQILLPECKADLPSEAEWEYACRAGSETAYSFGEAIEPQQANYYETQRRKTVPVKALPCNAWGLYQMHGNVWEWCADGMRTYTAQAQTDPRGPEGRDEVARVARGGSWFHSAVDARSAFRSLWHHDERYDSQGFRFALRSSEPGLAAGGRGFEAFEAGRSPVGESPEGASAALLRTARRDAGPFAVEGGAGPARLAPAPRGQPLKRPKKK